MKENLSIIHPFQSRIDKSLVKAHQLGYKYNYKMATAWDEEEKLFVYVFINRDPLTCDGIVENPLKLMNTAFMMFNLKKLYTSYFHPSHLTRLPSIVEYF